MINILFCGNDKVFDGMLTCMLSILMQKTTDEPFSFYIFTMDISRVKPEYVAIPDEQIAFLEKEIKEYNPENRVIKIDVEDLYNQEFAHCPNELAYCSPYTLLRLLADLVPDLPDKILYLDADIMFHRDIRLLYDTDIEGYEYVAAREHYGKYFINWNYINAGVLLFNMPEMKKTGLLEKSRHLIKTKKMLFADQSAIYKSTTKNKLLPQRFNDQRFLHKHTVVRHFSKRLYLWPYPRTDNIKQWHIYKVHKILKYNQFDDVLNEYIYLKKKYEKEVIGGKK